MSFLADYIVNVHHTYLKENTGQTSAYVRKIAEVHGDNHPEIIEIESVFNQIAVDLEGHLKEEEEDFFPALKRLDLNKKAGTAPAAKDIETITNSLKRLTEEHEEISKAIHKIVEAQ